MRWAAVMPELYFTLMAGVFLTLAMRNRVSARRDYAFALVLAALGIGVTLVCAGMEGSFFGGTYRVDPFSQILKVLIATGLFLVVWLCEEIDISSGQHPEFYFLLSTASLGMMFLVSSVELLTLYVALELTSYSLYVMVPLRDRRSEVGDQHSRLAGESASLIKKETSVGTGPSFRSESPGLVFSMTYPRGSLAPSPLPSQTPLEGGVSPKAKPCKDGGLPPMSLKKGPVPKREVSYKRSEVGGRRSEGKDQGSEGVRIQGGEGGRRKSEVGNGEGSGGQGMPTEAGIKYFLIGATVSAVMLFGMASLYGAARTTCFTELARALPEIIFTPMGFVGILFTLSGFFFKLAFFPFHVWGPTVYQAASDQVTTFIATTTKVMAIAVVTRLVAVSGGSESLAQVLLVLAIASMTLGNLAALVQNDMKRLLGYSAIAHAGYVLIGILSMTPRGYAAALFYAMAYLVMTFTCFLVVIKLSRGGRNLEVPDLAGLHRRSPLLAMALMVGVFSLGGIPPTIGFTGKFLVFTAAMEKGYFLLVLVAMINVAVSLYYYIQIIRAAYLLEPQEDRPGVPLSFFGRCITVLLVIVILVGGVFPKTIYEIAAKAAGVLP